VELTLGINHNLGWY